MSDKDISYIPATGKIFDSEGNIKNFGDALDSHNRIVQIDTTLAEVERGNLVSVKKEFTVPAGESYHIPYDVGDIEVLVLDRIVKATDVGSNGVNLDINTKINASITTAGNETLLFNGDLNQYDKNYSEISVYDETSVVNVSSAVLIEPISSTIIADKKATKDDFVLHGYQMKFNSVEVIEFVNNSSSDVDVVYKAILILKQS